jgi:hypothetical protein
MVLKNMSDDDQERYLIEILGRNNPHIDTVTMVKNLIVWRDTAEEILQGTLDALMFWFEVKESIKDEAMSFINKIKGNKPVAKETVLVKRTRENLVIKKALDEKMTLIKEMRKAGISNTRIHQILGFEFSISKMNQYIQQNIYGVK